MTSLRQDNEPAYIEVDPTSNVVTRVLCPLTAHVIAVDTTQAGDLLEVELVESHARHHVRRSNPDSVALLAALHAAQARGTAVLVTETLNEHEIIDVRAVPRPFVVAAAAGNPPGRIGPGFPAAAPGAVSPLRAQQLFDLVNSQLLGAGARNGPIDHRPG